MGISTVFKFRPCLETSSHRTGAASNWSDSSDHVVRGTSPTADLDSTVGYTVRYSPLDVKPDQTITVKVVSLRRFRRQCQVRRVFLILFEQKDKVVGP